MRELKKREHAMHSSIAFKLFNNYICDPIIVSIFKFVKIV